MAAARRPLQNRIKNMKSAQPTPTPEEIVPFTVPDGIEIQSSNGAISGKPQYRVAGFEMPWVSTPEIAVGVYERLKKANESGYFAASGVRRKDA